MIAFYKTNMNYKYQKTDTVEKCVILSSPTYRDGVIWMTYYSRMPGWWAIGKNTPRARKSNLDGLTLSTFWIQDQNDAKSTEGWNNWSVDMLTAPRFIAEARQHVTECQVNKLACIPMKFFIQLPSRIDATRLSTLYNKTNNKKKRYFVHTIYEVELGSGMLTEDTTMRDAIVRHV